jgi:glycosyltransferase involved in cell wall biosynthesis
VFAGDDLISSSKRLSVNFTSSFPPRECGIATFTYDLTTGITNVADDVTWNVSVLQQCQKLFLSNATRQAQEARWRKKEFTRSSRFISKVFSVIKDCNRASYVAAAKKVNDARVDVVNVQHEFGLYKGDFGDYILEFLRRVNKPIVTTLHTVLPNPPARMRDVVKDIYALSDRVAVSANAGIRLLEKDYGLDKNKLILIPHGVPTVPFVDTRLAKRRLGCSKKFVIASFGLINPDKGIEYVIEALPSVIEANPHQDVVYMVVGELHPALERKVREAYRHKLDSLIKRLGLSRNVVFVERYLSNREMIAFFLATDICTVANTNPDQISSGVLSQAIGCGKSIIATQFAHAVEALSNGRGLLVECGSSADIAKKINLLMADNELRADIARSVHDYAQSITWEKIARRYLDVFAQAKSQSALQQVPLFSYERTAPQSVNPVRSILS